MYRLKTIDVWDTLLRRDCHPEFAKLATALHVFLDPALGVAAHYETVWDVYRLRVEQEMLLADESRVAGKDNEYEIADVLRQWSTMVAGRPIDEQKVQQLAEFELEFELRHTYPDPTIRDVAAQYPAEKTLFLSDFYMSASRLLTLLRYHGMDEFVPNGVSSCDLGINKRSGKLFRHIEDAHQISPGEHVHIGDHLKSDFEVPRALGIHAVHFLPESEHVKRLARESVFEDRGSLFRQIQSEAASRCAPTQNTRSGRVAAYHAGVQASPLIIGFCLDVLECALSCGLERVYFFSREGEFFIRVWNALFASGKHAGHRLPSVSLLEVSRLATFCASLREITPHEMLRVWNLYTTHSLEALLRSLGLEPNAFAEVIARHQLSLVGPIRHPWQDPRIQSLFGDPEFKDRIEDKVHADRDALLGYLSMQGLVDDGTAVGIVDIGWRGTIQDNLAWLLPSVELHGFYLGLQTFLNEQPANTRKHAFGPNANESLSHSALLDAVSPIEMLFSSSLGSVCGYRISEDGSGVNVLRADTDMNHVASEDFVEGFQEGVIAAAQIWARPIETYAITARELRGPALAIWTALLARPLGAFVDAYTALNQNDVFGVGQFVNKRAVPSLVKLLLGVVSSEARREVILYIRQTQWAAGIWARRDLSFVHRTVLVTVLQLAKGYKRFSQRRSARSRTRHPIKE